MELDFDIKEINTDKDHIHLLISLQPIHYIPNIIQNLKGRIFKIILNDYKYLIKDYIWGKHLWNPSYFISTVSENTEQQIKKYIKNQKCK